MESRVRAWGRGFRVQFFFFCQRWTWNVNHVVTAITAAIINVIYPHVLGWEWFGLFDSVVWPGHINTARCPLPHSLQRSRLRLVRVPPGSVVFWLTVSQGRASVQQREICPGTEMLGGQHRNAVHRKKIWSVVGGEVSSDAQKKRFSGVYRKEWRRVLMLASKQKR